MKILKPKHIIDLKTGMHECPGCLCWYMSKDMRDVAWRRVKIGPYTETIEFCKDCELKRHEQETGERLMYRIREICLGLNLAKNRDWILP